MSGTQHPGKRNRVVRGVVALVGVLILTSCGSGAATGGSSASPPNYKLVNPGYLTVATYGSGPPVITVSADGTLGGLEGSWLNSFAQAQGLKLKVVQTTFASVILDVEQAKVDVGTYYYYTAARAQHVWYTYPFLAEKASVITLKSFNYTGPDSMSGKKIATILGFVWAPYLQKAFGANAVLFPDAASVETALLNGQVQGYVNASVALRDPTLANSTNVTAHLINSGDFGMPDSVLATHDYNFVKCDNKALADAMNAHLAKMHQTGDWLKALQAVGLTTTEDDQLQSPAELCA